MGCHSNLLFGTQVLRAYMFVPCQTNKREVVIGLKIKVSKLSSNGFMKILSVTSGRQNVFV